MLGKWGFATLSWENSCVITVWVWVNVWCLNCLLSDAAPCRVAFRNGCHRNCHIRSWVLTGIHCRFVVSRCHKKQHSGRWHRKETVGRFARLATKTTILRTTLFLPNSWIEHKAASVCGKKTHSQRLISPFCCTISSHCNAAISPLLGGRY